MADKGSEGLFLLNQWSKSISDLAFAVGTDRFIHVLLASIKRIVDFDFVMVFGYQGIKKPLALGDTLDADRHQVIVDSYAAGPFLLDPFFKLLGHGTHNGCHRLDSISSDSSRKGEYFRIHYSSTGIGEEIGFIFQLSDSLTGILSLGRWQQSTPVTNPELAILRAVEPAISGLCAQHWSHVDGDHARWFQSGEAVSQFGEGKLSPREHEIVAMILQGHSTESVALQLDISPGTVKIHRKNMYRKLRVSTQAELFSAFLDFAFSGNRRRHYPQGDMASLRKVAHILHHSNNGEKVDEKDLVQ